MRQSHGPLRWQTDLGEVDGHVERAHDAAVAVGEEVLDVVHRGVHEDARVVRVPLPRLWWRKERGIKS